MKDQDLKKFACDIMNSHNVSKENFAEIQTYLDNPEVCKMVIMTEVRIKQTFLFLGYKNFKKDGIAEEIQNLFRFGIRDLLKYLKSQVDID